MRYLFLFPLCTIILHLYFLYHKVAFARFFTKALLMPSLLLFFLLLFKNRNLVFENLPLLVLAYALYTFGDILLELKAKPCFFYFGVISFASGHICNSAFFLSQGIKIYDFILYAVLWCFIFASLLYFLKKEGSEELFLTALYIFFVLIMGLGIGGSRISFYSKLLSLLGALIFCLSDSLIALRRTHGNTESYDMGIMVTYIGANVLILSGLCLN